MTSERRPWSAMPCEVCDGHGILKVDANDHRVTDTVVIVASYGDTHEVICWYCDGDGWYEAAL